MTTLILATRNAHKVQEIRAILDENFRYLSLLDFVETPTIIEDQPTFAKNAAKKTKELAKWFQHLDGLDYRVPKTNGSMLADDSNLEIDALNKAPGMHSTQFAAIDRPNVAAPKKLAQNCSDADNNTKLLRLMKDVPMERRGARFRCVLS